MAGDWIKVESTTPDKPEVFQVAEDLGLDPDAVLGKLIRVWIWADGQTYDGDAPGVTRALLDHVARCEGFASSLFNAGWLEIIRTPLTVGKAGGEVDRLVFPHFDRHNGQTAKSRALTAKRMAVSRAETSDAVSVTSASPEKRREEKRRGKGETPLQTPPAFAPSEVAIPGELNTEAFLQAWTEWIEHRQQIRKKLTPLAVTKQIKRLAKMGEARAIRTIEHTIERQWVGLVEPLQKPEQSGTPIPEDPSAEVRREAARHRAEAAAEPLAPMADVVKDMFRKAD